MSAEPVISTGDVELLLHATCVRGVPKSGPAPAPLQERTIDFRILVEPPLLSATITDLCNEPLFYSGYLSEEETMSSSSSDNSSLSSISTVADEFLDELETNFPELLAEDCTFVEQAQCNQAEVVTLVSPGKARVVRVSRVNLSASSSPIIKRPATSSSLTPSGSSSRLSIISIRAHSHDGSVASPKMVSPKMPSTPELEPGSQTPESSHGPPTPGSPASAYFDALTSPTYACPPKHRMSRNGYHLKLPGMTKQRPGSSQSMMAAPLSAPLVAPASFFKPKMMARGAGERMASLDLPPYPRDFIQQPPKSRWTVRKDSVSSISSKEVPRFRLKRAESGILPTWR
ncbi:hypothetical protein D6D02_03299 [Aureobasidium pullulans]|nr:hypothetical protein D6D02_03299 [Aureobasidium pullulans]THY39306.1 hypothetical protein D6C98_10056 [Aureobasidium pullulans]